MKVLILNLLISYILCVYSSNSTISRKLFNLTIHGTIGYNGNTPSLTILDLSGCKDDVIYITYKINRRDFNTDIIYYEFTDVYPNEYFECANQMKSSHSSTSSSGSKHFKTYTFKLSFEFGKQNKKYLVLENIIYKGYQIEVKNTIYNPRVQTIILIILSVLILVASLIFYVYYKFFKNKKRIESKSIDFKKEKKEEPSPLYPPNQTYDSTQANTIPMQQLPYEPQPIPPEVMNSNDTVYSSGMGQQDGYSSGMGQGYYSGMAVPPS